MPKTYDECIANLDKLLDAYTRTGVDGINEDTTRMRFIDALFFDCLDWDRYTQAETEERTDVGIIDYSLSLNGTLLIVEAKKAGISFILPREQTSHVRPVRSLNAIISLDKGIASAIAQAASYALEKGSPFAVVSNGWQVIAFSTRQPPGVSWRKGNALVFDSIAAIRENFKLFWNGLSVEAIRRFDLEHMLRDPQRSAPCPARSATLQNFERSKNRNDFQADLQILGDLVFGGRIFEDRSLFQKYCYCAGGALPQFSQATNSYLEDRYPQLFETTAATPTLEPAQTKKGPAAALSNLTNIRKPILLLGDVGVGKTTFLEHLFLVDWAARERDTILLRVDLADKPSRLEDLPDLVATEIEESLRVHYDIDINENKFIRAVYHAELARFKRTPAGTTNSHDSEAFKIAELAHIERLRSRFDEHWRSLFLHLVKARHKIVVLIFDNVDQRDADMQKATFIQAQVAASKWDIFVMVALRPDTFVRSKLHGAISGYHPRAFTISPPRFDQLMEKRIEAAAMMLRGELPLPTIGEGATIQIQHVSNYLDVLKYSFAREPELLAFCEDISCGNMRLALDYIIAFMSCGHVDARKILERWQENGSYAIPLHEFTRGVMFSDREYYSSKKSAIANVFDCRSGDSRESFILLCLLSVLSKVAKPNAAADSQSGYLETEDVRRALLYVGFDYSQANWCIERAMGARLIETNLKDGAFDNATHMRISSAGSHYFNKLVRTFVYLDAVSIDTPICDKVTLTGIDDVTLLQKRLERARRFLAYLNQIAKGQPGIASLCDWDLIRIALDEDMQRAEAGNARAIAMWGRSGNSASRDRRP